MFDIGWSELVVIGIVALIAIGPKELPGVLRMLGQWMGKVRRMASDFQGQFQEAMREAEMAGIKTEVDKFTDFSKDFGNFDPVETARKEIESAIESKPAVAPVAPVLDENGMPVTPPSTTPAVAESAEPTPPAVPAPAPEPNVAAVPDAAKSGEGGRAA
jgi:sec-independent protein translocase protein TatB